MSKVSQPENIERAAAEQLLAAAMVPHMPADAQADALEEAWHFDNEDAIREAMATGMLPKLSNEAIKLIASTDAPPEGDFEGRASLMHDWCMFGLRYVTNQYLESQLASRGRHVAVHGAPKEAGCCPCCEHYAIDPGEDGACDICPVCWWENFGPGPNHMSLEEARHNYREFGAMSRKALGFVGPDGPKKYRRK